MTEDKQEPVSIIKARPGQGVGRTGAIIPQTICKMMSDAVKSGDIDRFMQEQMKYNIEVRDVVDISQFNQSLIFSAAAIPDEEQAIKMITILI